MFQRWSHEHLLLIVAIVICITLTLGYSIPGLDGLYSVTTQCVFALAGSCALFLGCVGLYATWKRGY
ncbi:hypothetical protein [Dictyobacter arantiisoli]|uniref:Uncharacterized protein n=1 Tax=Dictyobacter arantiisoli TaxID=2014874 RepID=A0A5A5TEG3_9CHLR|nr:hypothetical protein [Dictyobacter arantiisoli]GCF09536.1 hypothetical protein KDI_31000 [Dictyobacter arantiisoli]